MGKDAYEAFMRLSFIRSGSEGRTEEPFVARDGALDLPAIPVKAVVEATLHLRTIFRRRRLVPPRWFKGITVDRMPSSSRQSRGLCSAS